MLDNTFKDTKIEFEDLDGLSWPENPTPSQVNPDLPPLEPLFGLGKPSIQTAIHETGLVGVPSSTTCQCNFDRSLCQSHPRKLSRSRRTSEINFNLPRVEVPDPFAFVPMPSGQEQESDLPEKVQLGAASIMRPPSVKQVESQSRPFRVLELPPEVDLSSIGPPPGLPPPRSGFQPVQGIPFPTRA